MKNRLLNIARIVISLLLLLFLFYKLDLQDVKPLIKAADISFLILSFIGYILLLLFSTMRWWLLLNVQGVKLPFIRVFGYYITGMFFNNFLPPTIGGGTVRAIFAGRDTGKNKESFASMTCELLLGFIGLFIFVTILLLFYLMRL
ncbi:flippase-like domain-containing protein, partial [candidate division WOR-3 bacterium]|nr:flippase-like domain-containing protein [candidate division WOR-3 bacterium]